MKAKQRVAAIFTGLSPTKPGLRAKTRIEIVSQGMELSPFAQAELTPQTLSVFLASYDIVWLKLPTVNRTVGPDDVSAYFLKTWAND